MKTFAEMSPKERAAWVSQEVEAGKLKAHSSLAVFDRMEAVLSEYGPMTTQELADHMGYRRYGSMVAWANKNRLKMAERGIMRHVDPDDTRRRIWLLESHIRVEDEPVKVQPPTLLDRLGGANDAS